MAMPATLPRRWTRPEVEALIDANPLQTPRYELIDGELLVTPSPGPAHQSFVGSLFTILHAYVAANGLGKVFFAPADLELRPGNINQPDLFVLPPGIRPGRRWRGVTSLRLAVEVLSKGSRRHDRVTKRFHYQEIAVPEYWIVDIDAGVVERWRPTDDRPQILTDRLTWQPDAGIGALVIDLAALFAEAAAVDDEPGTSTSLS